MGVTDKAKGSNTEGTHAKTMSTRKGSGGATAKLKVRGGSGSTTGHSTSKKN